MDAIAPAQAKIRSYLPPAVARVGWQMRLVPKLAASCRLEFSALSRNSVAQVRSQLPSETRTNRQRSRRATRSHRRRRGERRSGGPICSAGAVTGGASWRRAGAGAMTLFGRARR